MPGMRRLAVLTPALLAALAVGPTGTSQAAAAPGCAKGVTVSTVQEAAKTGTAQPRRCRRGHDRAQYQRGYRDGFRQGFRDGRHDCRKRTPRYFHRTGDCYTFGWIAGYERGYSRFCGH